MTNNCEKSKENILYNDILKVFNYQYNKLTNLKIIMKLRFKLLKL